MSGARVHPRFWVITMGGVKHRYLGAATMDGAGHFDGLGEALGGLPPHHPGNVFVVRADRYDAAHVGPPMLAPVPHEEGVRAVVRMACPV